MIYTINSLVEMKELKDEWNRILLCSSNSTPFQSWEWNYGIARNYSSSESLRIIVEKNEEGRIIGIAPLKLKNFWIPGVKILEFIGTGSSDYLDFLIEEPYKDIFIKNLFDWLRENDEWQILNFVNLRTATKDLISIHYPFEVSRQDLCLYLPLPSSLEEFQSEIPKSLYKSIKKRLNKLLKNGRLQFSVSESLEDFHSYMNALFRLHQKRWEDKGERGRFYTEELREKFRDLSLLMFKAGLLKIGVLKIDTSIVSVHYHLILKHREYGYLKGMDVDYSKFSPGNLLHYFMFQDAIRNGTLLIDFLQGSESYKYEWAKKEVQLYKAFTFRSRANNLLWKSSQKIRHTVYNSKTIKKIYFLFIAMLSI